MIKFFRHIRQRLIKENRFSKYLLYAVGEIVLVVIGILIALQINTWNNERIENEAERKVLIELRKGIVYDANVMQQSLSQILFQIDKMKYLKRLLKNKDQMYNKGLDTLFGAVYGVRTIRVNKAFYEDLKASGLKLIKDDEIRLDIVNLFEDNYVLLDKIFDMELHINDVIRPYYLEHFNEIDFLDQATPNDFSHVWSDTYYQNIVHYRILNLESNHVDTYRKTVAKIMGLSGRIKAYINLLDD